MKKNIKISSIPAFRRTLKSITNIPEMSLSSYILRSDLNLSEMEYTQKYYFSNIITTNDFKLLIDFLNKQKEENKEEIEEAQNFEQITSLINQLVSLTDFEKIMKKNNQTKTTVKPNKLKKPSISNVIQEPYNIKENILPKQKIDKRNIRADSILYTKDMSDSFNKIIHLLKIPPFKPIYGKLPIAASYFYYLKSNKKNGKDFNVSSEAIHKITDYFVPIIQDKYHTLSSSEQNILRHSYENFCGQIFPEIDLESIPDINSEVVKTSESKSKEVLVIENDNETDTSSGSTLISIELSNAIKNICSILNLKSHYKQDGGVPLSEYSLHYWTKPIKKSVNTKKFLTLKNYFQNIVDKGKNNLSDEDWNRLKQNWEVFNERLPYTPKISSEVNIVEITDNKAQVNSIPVQEILTEAKTNLSNENDQVNFVLNHREFIKKKKEADDKLELMLIKRIDDSYKRDRLLKIQDALKDMPILSTLALSKEKHYSEKVYEIRDFTLTNTKDKESHLKNIKAVDFISENPEINLSETKLYLSEDDYEQYQFLKKEIKKDDIKVEIKLVLDNESKLRLYLDYSY